jgi:hypothetical protein
MASVLIGITTNAVKMTLTITGLTLGLLGCGGGDGGDSSAASSSDAAAVSDNEQANESNGLVPSENTRNMQDLSVDPDFSYELVETRQLSFEFDTSESDTSFLSIYSKFEQTRTQSANIFRPDPRYKIAQVTLVGGKAEVEVTFDSANTNLLAEVWSMDSDQPKQILIQPLDDFITE